MLTTYKTYELLLTSLLFMILMGFTRSFLLGYKIDFKTLSYNSLFFFIWYGIFLNT